MKLFQIMKMEIKKSLTSDLLLSVVLLFSIILSYSVVIYYNDSFFCERRLYLSSNLELHSVDIEFSDSITYSDAIEIIESLDTEHCEYVLFGVSTNTKGETYSINSLWTMISKTKNPYDYLFSSMRQERLLHEPRAGTAYISNKFNTGRHGEGLYYQGQFSVEDTVFTVVDYFAPTANIDVLVSNEDFQQKNKVNTITFSYRESTPLSFIQKINEKISLNYPDSIVHINNVMDEMGQESYSESILITSILMLACVVNYCLIFTYLAGKRFEDYTIMRLFGISKFQISVMLLLEFLLYNIIAMFISMIGFCIFWHIQGYADILIHIFTAMPIIMVFIVGSLSIGLFQIMKFCRIMPIKYKEQ